MTPIDIQWILSITRKAGDIALSHFGRTKGTLKTDNSWVTQADVDVEGLYQKRARIQATERCHTWRRGRRSAPGVARRLGDRSDRRNASVQSRPAGVGRLHRRARKRRADHGCVHSTGTGRRLLHGRHFGLLQRARALTPDTRTGRQCHPARQRRRIQTSQDRLSRQNPESRVRSRPSVLRCQGLRGRRLRPRVDMGLCRRRGHPEGAGHTPAVPIGQEGGFRGIIQRKGRAGTHPRVNGPPLQVPAARVSARR